MENIPEDSPILTFYIHYTTCMPSQVEKEIIANREVPSRSLEILQIRYQNHQFELLTPKAVTSLKNGDTFSLGELSFTIQIEDKKNEIIETISRPYHHLTEKIPVLECLRKLAPIETDHLTLQTPSPEDELAFLEKSIEKSIPKPFLIDESIKNEKKFTLLNDYFKSPEILSTSPEKYEENDIPHSKEKNILHELGLK